MKANLVVESKLAAAYARAVRAVASWLTPRRVKVYPIAFILGAVVFIVWLEILAVGRGLPVSKAMGVDFVAFYTGGRLFLEGRMSDLYDYSTQKALQETLIAPNLTGGILPFINPPFTVLLYAPFAWGSYETGKLLWWASGLLTLILSLHLLRRELSPSEAPFTGRWLGISFLFFPTLAWFLYAQNTHLTLLVYALTFLMLRRGRDLGAGAALGVLLYKPQLAIGLAVALLVQRRWRALLGGALSVGLLLSLGFALSREAMLEYADLSPGLVQLQLSVSTPTAKAWAVHTFYGFALLLLDGVWPTGADLSGIVLTVGGVLLVAGWWRQAPWRPGSREWDLKIAATLALGLLISPYLFLYDLMLLLLPLAIVWSHYPRGTGGRLLDGGALLVWSALLYVGCFAGSYLTLGQFELTKALGLPRIAVQLTVPITVAWAWLVSRAAEHSPSPSPAAVECG